MKLVIANWKSNPATLEEAVALAQATDQNGIVLCPPLSFLEAVKEVIQHAVLGAQDVSLDAADELLSLRVKYVIVGHSSRRKLGETDEIIAQKVQALVREGITPVLCVGETRVEHQEGRTEEVIRRQLEVGLSLVASGEWLVAPIITYEPVWAISIEPDAQPDTPENAVSMAQFIKRTLHPTPYTLDPHIFYGGSVNPENVRGFLERPEIQGVLVGGASLKPDAMHIITGVASQS